jgi:hypothetical protein
MKKALIVLISFFVFSACNDDKGKTQPNGYVLAFHAEKCMCCWGWDIKIGNDTIRTESGILAATIGYQITKSIPVYVELGTKENNCGDWSPEYYIVKSITVIDD